MLLMFQLEKIEFGYNLFSTTCSMEKVVRNSRDLFVYTQISLKAFTENDKSSSE